MFEEQRRTARSRYPLRNLGNLEYWIDLCRNALEFVRRFQAFNKVAQVLIGHDGPPECALLGVKQPHSVARFITGSGIGLVGKLYLSKLFADLSGRLGQA